MDQILETLVALGAMYLFLSLAALAVVEAISSLLDMRAKHLKKGIEALLEDKATPILESPLLRSLGRASGRRKSFPSYLPSDFFATAVMGGVPRKDGAKDLVAAAKDSGIPALAQMAEEAGADTKALKQKIERWFEAGMERVSGGFKRSIRWVTRIVVIVLVVGLNADTYEVGRLAWNDASARQGALLYSQKLLGMCALDETGKLTCPGLAESGAEAAAAFPLGWTASKWGALQSTGDYLYKLIGLLVTALAASLGAPFWFDVLRRVAPGLRHAGPKPEEKPTTTLSEEPARRGSSLDEQAGPRLSALS